MNSDTDNKTLFRQLYDRARCLYSFTSLMNKHMKHTNCSTIAPEITMMETHTLIDIMENPNISLVELGRLNNKSKGAISQTIKKLEGKGLLVKNGSETNKKVIKLNLTETGRMAAEEHAKSDAKDLTSSLNALVNKYDCTIEEIDSFYKVLDCYIKVLNDFESNRK